MDDDDYYGPRFTLLSMLFDASRYVLVPLAISMIVVPIVLYGFARARQNREPFPDPQLGLKFSLSYFKTMSFHALLWGGVLLAFTILMKSKDKSDVYRPAFGVVVPAAMVYATQVWALFRTNQDEAPLVPRMMAGWSLMISGVFGLAGLFFVSQTIFQKGSAGEPGRFAWALFLVYGSAWIVQTVRYFRSTWATQQTAAMAPYYPPPPGAYAGDAYPAAPPAAAGSPGLPSPFTTPSPFAPPHPGYAPPSPFAPPAEGAAAEAPTAPVFAPPSTAPSPFAPGAPVPDASSPFAPPARQSGPTAVPTVPSAPPAPAVPVPAPMAKPLAPPGSAPSVSPTPTPPPGFGGGSGGSGSGTGR